MHKNLQEEDILPILKTHSDIQGITSKRMIASPGTIISDIGPDF